MHSFDNVIKIGARDSRLSKSQVFEALEEIKMDYPDFVFECIFVKTFGDKDKTTSLRNLEKTNFFTKEIDEMLLDGRCRIAVHSAKDLPDPLPQGIVLAKLTRGVNSSDSLVMREGCNFFSLPQGAKVATSSLRREQNVLKMRSDLQIVDIRGTIEERLDFLDSNKVDAVVIAEAALIRLRLTHLNRIKVEGQIAPLQGRLAIVVRENDAEMLNPQRDFFQRR